MQEQHEELGETHPPRALTRLAPLILIGTLVVLILCYLLIPPPEEVAPEGRSDQGANHTVVGTRLETIEFQPLTAEGPDVTAADLEGKVTLINYWGPWCGFCKVEFPHLVELEKKYRERDDFRFLSISCSSRAGGSDLEMKANTVQFLRQARAEFPAYRDAFARTRNHLMRATQRGTANDFVYPTTLVLGPDLVIRGLWDGYAPGDELQMLDVVEAALREK